MLFNRSQATVYTEKESAQIETALEESFGAIQKIYHEIVSDDVHLDIATVAETADMPFQKLFTIGMGAKKMHVPAGISKKDFERAELALFLTEPTNEDWPFTMLKTVARMPFEQNTWVGHGHTVDLGNDLIEGYGFRGVLLLSLHGNECELKITGGKKINYYLIIPLYPEELQYAQLHGTNALMDRFDENGITPVFDVNRKNCC